MAIDVTDATFETEVVQRSMTTPVVVDLWAPWCGPCKTLGPIIEKVVGETNGKVVLAKINVDENPRASATFRVQSIPAVYALVEGQIVDGFMGAQPEAQVREFVDKLTVGEQAGELDALVAAGDEASLRRAVELDPTYLPAVGTLAQMLLMSGRAAEAVEVLAPVADDPAVAPLVEAAREHALPSDERSRIDTQLDELLATVKGDDDARQQFLELLDELAVGDPEGASRWRRKLSTALF
ncbi:MAG: thioredoxin domain-containing protein [Actinomycetota bacterium]